MLLRDALGGSRNICATPKLSLILQSFETGSTDDRGVVIERMFS